jgi:hypothetical protein
LNSYPIHYHSCLFFIRILSCFFFLGTLLGFGQNEIELGTPLDIPLALSGNFAELRGGHFHAGLDIKTKGRQGLKVKAVEAGSIRRIRVSTSGYGKTLYIEHNNGLTSVYAHLQKFAPKIEAFIKVIQYEKERFEVQQFLRKDELTVTKGEIIGYSGNTGGSFGPHLHFEVRDTDLQTPLNPLRMGLNVQDTQRPQFRQLYLFDDQERLFQDVPLQKINDSVYQTNLLFTQGKIGLGLSMFDRQDLSYNRNGIYRVEVLLNGQKVYAYQFDEIDFKDGEYIPLFIDYALSKTKKRRLYKLFTPAYSKLSFLNTIPSNGFLLIENEKSYQVKVIVTDFHGNRAYLESYIDGQNTKREFSSLTPTNPTHTITPEKDYLVQFEDKGVYFPKNSFFSTQNIRCENLQESLKLETPLVPVRKAFEISFNPPKGDSLNLAQMAIVRKGEKGKNIFFATRKKAAHWIAKTKEGGIYQLQRDSLSPSIKPLNFKEGQWLSRYRYLKIHIEDTDSGIRSYRGTINGEWVRFEYEPKLKLLTYDFRDKTFRTSKHELQLEVTDGVGNRSVYETTLYRKYGLDK